MEAFAGLGAIVALIGLLLSVLWICLPFAVFGTKAKLDVIAAEQRASSDLLRQVIGELQALRGGQAPKPSHPVSAPADAAQMPSVPTAPLPAAPFDERAAKLARARALAAEAQPSVPGESRLE